MFVITFVSVAIDLLTDRVFQRAFGSIIFGLEVMRTNSLHLKPVVLAALIYSMYEMLAKRVIPSARFRRF